MLDIETKRRIDNARDILVGKIPDPKGQVEQITLALTYKFMDDMDRQSEEWGGEASFFTGEFSHYSWSSIFDPKLGGYELLNLYSEALIKMNQNPNIPVLFREIFKNAYLPYRDPETLKSFLKEINGFYYDHSERLGDAYEYLLSVLGSQGDAGQFRTPRNIIDFIVKVLDPKKNDTILDPACGTAGFLVSSFKHIMEQNTKDSYGDLLTPEERNRFITNFTGYDISPDMVRISLVNMYLHGFADPKIYEYDTLTSEERWNDTADVILANPPFMTPTGGIRPHKRFSIKANRSEVLFVDYIAEHLNNNGRAGIIVPEGIIFQSGNAYKALRKMLVENYLYAVVSLPAGVFNPYAGVKTSILFIDKTLAKKTDSILFVKVENDGFDLGAQRREINKNDLPDALSCINLFKQEILQGRVPDETLYNIAITVKKEIIGANGDYNLSGERYRNKIISSHATYPMVRLGDEELFRIESGGTPDSRNSAFWDGDVKWVTLADLPSNNLISEIVDTQRHISLLGLEKSSAKLLPPKTILLSSRATIGRIGIAMNSLATNQGFKNIIIKDFSKVNERYVAYMLTYLKEKIESMATGGTFKEISKTNLSTLLIPLPPIEVQREIVAEIEGYQKMIDEAKSLITSNYEKIKERIGETWGGNNID